MAKIPYPISWVLSRTDLQQNLQGPLAARLLEGCESISQGVAVFDQRLDIDRSFVQQFEGRTKGPTARTDKIQLMTPEIAENGAIVPIQVISEIPSTEKVFVFAEKN